MVNWDVDDLRAAFEEVGLVVEVSSERSLTQLHITSALLDRWFATTTATSRPSYAVHLERSLTKEEVRAVQNLFTRSLLNQTVTWESTIAFVQAESVQTFAR
jgi:putative ATPase